VQDRTSHRVLSALAVSCAAAAVLAASAWAQPIGTPRRTTLWDLQIGSHARELPRAVYADFACGTNGGPPSLPLADWAGYARCPVDKDTGLREVYFRYDDDFEIRQKAQDPLGLLPLRMETTSEFQIPVIVSGLFDDKGFLAGMRMISDPRVNEEMRERGMSLYGALRSRFGDAGWTCTDLPPTEGETPFRGSFTKQHCEKVDTAAGVHRTLDMNYFRKPGQVLIDPVSQLPTTGAFVSETRYTAKLINPIADADARLARIADPPPTEVEINAQRARNCPGCDLRQMNLKRADLRNAKLAGADLTGANLHDAILTGADLTGAKLEEANLNRADLRQAKLSGAYMLLAMLYMARLDGANLEGADLSAVLAARAQMISGNAKGAIAINADFRMARLLNSDFSGADLSEALLQDAQMARVNLQGATLVDAQAWNTSLTEVNLTNADARGVQLTGANLREADLSGADFSEATLDQTVFTGVTAKGTKFDGAKPRAPMLR
jgi:uncharacterized protein YjbI with pentapeptide repeats